MEPEPEHLADPQMRAYLEAVAERAKPFLHDSSSRYDVWMIIPKRRACGWPFESSALAAMVGIDEHEADGNSQQYIFFADDTGASPERWAGWVGNWFFYLVLSFPLIWMGERLLGPIIRRFRKPPGFCRSCGYNLAGNTSGICPECGTPIPDETKEKLTARPVKQ